MRERGREREREKERVSEREREEGRECVGYVRSLLLLHAGIVHLVLFNRRQNKGTFCSRGVEAQYNCPHECI